MRSAGNTLYTKWGQNLDIKNILDEYPRPHLVRDSFLNLNGEWDYAITSNEKVPKEYDGTIIVPFSPESVLSQVERQLYPSQVLWYKRKFNIKVNKTNKYILHFGGVDQFCEITLNNYIIGDHKGGYLPFSYDITSSLAEEEENELIVMVRDKTCQSYFAHGKQKLRNGGIWYQPQSGIWQTVWIEEVPYSYVKNIRFTTDFDKKTVRCDLDGIYDFEYKITFAGEAVVEGESNTGSFEYVFKKFNAWTPETPNMYDVEIKSYTDHVKSYFTMRKVSYRYDDKGFMRFQLNNKFYPQVGILDQGMWSDGLYTPASYDAIRHDIILAKNLGYNMIRKHAKIEPLVWYYECDKMGILVWQDIVNGGKHPNIFHQIRGYLGRYFDDKAYWKTGRYSKLSRDNFEYELLNTYKTLNNYNCIVVWTLFNEGWGQYDTQELTDKLAKMDRNRLIDSASGWYDKKCGNFSSKHIYWGKIKFDYNDRRIKALTEFGGYYYKIYANSLRSFRRIGYKKFKTVEAMYLAYEKLIYDQILPNIKNYGLDICIFTQLSDIEDELNGIITYDREIVKFDILKFKKLNQLLLQRD